MNRKNAIQYLTGFIVGAILGIVLNYIGLGLYNTYCYWIGCTPMTLTWGNAIPLPLLLGLSLAINVANYPLRD